jgi:hypothetical protein
MIWPEGGRIRRWSIRTDEQLMIGRPVTRVLALGTILDS